MKQVLTALCVLVCLSSPSQSMLTHADVHCEDLVLSEIIKLSQMDERVHHMLIAAFREQKEVTCKMCRIAEKREESFRYSCRPV